jgi:hypothetical protein
MNKLISLTSLLAGLILLAPGCASDASIDEVDCSGGKCDTPGGVAGAECQAAFPNDREAQAECRDDKALDHCALRRSDALESSQRGFTKDAIRWAAADVDGVNTNGNDDRGQEYTEYFAFVMPPPATEGGEAGRYIALGQNQPGGGTTAPNLELVEDQIFALEDEPDAIVGQCIFTSWHADINEPMPICNGDGSNCPGLPFAEDATLGSWISSPDSGLRMTTDNLRMKVGFNSNGAASDLAERCMTDPLVADSSDASDPLNDNYTRGCMKAYDLFQTEWRRSDSAVCVVGTRLTECGCGVDTNADGVADITDPKEISLALVPRQPVDNEITLRGFPLGTWSGASELPSGCHYVDTGDQSQTLVSCDLSGTDVLSGAADVKERCRAKYGNNVVTHVPIPSAAIVCDPAEGSEYAASCGDTPWVVTAENSSPSAP